MLAENSRIIILGDWISHFSYAAFDGENLSLLLFENQTLY
jgi:UDP-2,3-diacylglucosamine hydrolase